MRIANYDFVLHAWNPPTHVFMSGWCQSVHVGLPYVEFHAVTDRACVSVRCDPCSLDQSQAAYAAMVRTDLENAIVRSTADEQT